MAPNAAIITNQLAPGTYMTMVATVAATAGGLYGYDTGIISGALPQIAQEFDLGYRAQELVTAAILAGAVFGALSSTYLSAKLGRRVTIMIVAGVYSVAVLAAALAPGPWFLAGARFCLGIAVGGSTQIVPAYIAELAPPEKRGSLVTYFNVSIGIGILLAAVVGVAGHNLFTWRWMFGVAVVPSILLLLGMIKLPGSPRWLVEHYRPKAAAKVLQKVRETSAEVRAEISDMQEMVGRINEQPETGWRAMRQPWLRPALIAGLGVAAFTQLSGIEMMIYYTPTFLKDAGFGPVAALWSALGVAITYLVMTFVGKLIVDRVGRRRLSLLMIPGAIAALLVLGAVLHFDLAGSLQPWWVVGCLIVFMVFNSGGIQVVGWLTGSEIYPLSIRDQALGAHAAMLWGSNLLLTGTALSVTKALGVGGAMWLYAGLNALGWLFIFRLVPETAGRSLEDIERSLKDGVFLPNRQVRPQPFQA
ncbi:sugar porter family MFS transporter [Sphingomonas sp. S2-65]|uniref:sugar porter family MFS transporter n=1 Tax=Sphingomonas sp. S2-65 TaxID=2903960 RepID=UPI001F2EC5EE|nr:sugar porter family MFS transporter [Sphingomonas sp. S2-65]UYY59318.1 sugar porter family MFS transporter [Sphingomonas sp. S2-65]